MSKDPRVDDRSEDAFEALLLESARVTADYDADQDDLEATSQFEVADRAALRRVQGFSTQLQDISDAEYRELQLERVILVGVWTEGTAQMAENSLDELKALAQTAGSEVLDGFIQRRDKPDPATYIGSGKVEELRNVVAASGADTVICDGELSPSQLQQLEGKLKVKVVDRTALILDIFAQHAKSTEGKAQVELAQISYLLPRLRGGGESLSRQVGGESFSRYQTPRAQKKQYCLRSDYGIHECWKIFVVKQINGCWRPCAECTLCNIGSDSTKDSHGRWTYLYTD